jgi:hypothetical protein
MLDRMERYANEMESLKEEMSDKMDRWTAHMEDLREEHD